MAPLPPTDNSEKRKSRHEQRLSKGEQELSPRASNSHQLNGDDRRLTGDLGEMRIEPHRHEGSNSELDKNLRNDINRQDRRSDNTPQHTGRLPHSPPGSKSPTKSSNSLSGVVLPIVSEVRLNYFL